MLDILYEDSHLLFVNKPPDIVVQRGFDPDEPVLYEIAAAHASPLFLMQRLDRGTSGVMFFSKSSDANAKLTRQFERKRIRKRYLAICEGELAERQTIDAPLRRTGAITFWVRQGGKRAVTDVEPISSSAKGSLVSITLHTGRTHQIRVHMAAIGHSLAGDWLYGDRNAERPMLHSVEAPLPPDFLAECAAREIVTARGQNDPSGLQLNY